MYISDFLHHRKLNMSNLRMDLRFRHQAAGEKKRKEKNTQ
jgi:hypothetical protein